MKLINVDETGGSCANSIGPCNSDFLYKHNFLSEFITEKDKQKARKHLGIDDTSYDVEEKINKVYEQIDSVNTTLTKSITDLSQNQEWLEGENDNNKENITKIQTNLSSLSNDVDKKYDTLDTKIDNEIFDLGNKVQTLTSNVSNLTTKVTEINKVLRNNFSSVTLTASPEYIEKGETEEIELIWNYTYNGNIEKISSPNTMELKSGDTVLATTDGNYIDMINDSKTYQVFTVVDGVSKNSEAITVKAYYPIYAGICGDTFDADTIVASSESQDTKTVYPPKTAFGVSLTYTEENTYGWFCFPSGYGTPTGIQVNGVDASIETGQTTTINGRLYRSFRLTTSPGAGTYYYKLTFDN